MALTNQGNIRSERSFVTPPELSQLSRDHSPLDSVLFGFEECVVVFFFEFSDLFRQLFVLLDRD